MTVRRLSSPGESLSGNPGTKALRLPAQDRHAEIRAQRARIGELLGRLRDTQHEHDSDATGRLSAENATLRQRIRDITAGQRTLEERLQAARSNNRFLDKRISGLEAQLLTANTGTGQT